MLAESVLEAAARCSLLASAEPAPAGAGGLAFSEEAATAGWRSAVVHLHAVFDALASFEGIDGSPSGKLSACARPASA
ncbi:MAG: hypothetical protein BGP06_04030 [Rhizobiales bacterium 65-9]|nr:MAG: hypothetical protein BGP06_04030 [Rhizobiales bacterium 65-9]